MRSPDFSVFGLEDDDELNQSKSEFAFKAVLLLAVLGLLVYFMF